MAPPRKTYYDWLRHPKWQKIRLELLKAANWECTYCGAADVELHVHHLVYRRGARPWEYADGELEVLCADCHANAESEQAAMMEAITALSNIGDYKSVVTGMALAVALLEHVIPAAPVNNIGVATGIGLVFGIRDERVIEIIHDGKVSEDDLVGAGGTIPPDYRRRDAGK